MSATQVVLGALFLLVAGLGAGVRFLASQRLNREFPLGTLLVNVAASAALGFVVAADDPIRTIVGIGALGALSTWSAAANEAATLSREDQVPLALGYLGLTVTSGVLAAWFGLRLGASLLG